METIETRFTEKENALINAIINSDYANGDVLDPVWLPLPKECGFDNNKTLSGVVSQLVQKGLVVVDGKGNDATISFTQKYIDLK
jgi:hypothetical protein